MKIGWWWNGKGIYEGTGLLYTQGWKSNEENCMQTLYEELNILLLNEQILFFAYGRLQMIDVSQRCSLFHRDFEFMRGRC